MKIRLTIIRQLLCVALITAGSLGTQAQVYYDFENDSANWQSSHSELWSVSDAQAAKGNNSLRYSLDNTYNNTTGLISIVTNHTIAKVCSATFDGETVIIGSSHEGVVIAVAIDGTTLWENKLSGYYNHDVWCADLSGDGNDELLLANADGSIYCLDSKGKQLWKFRVNEAPMNAVAVIHKNNDAYVVCGGFDMSYYYLNTNGEQLKEIKSSNYSQEKSWGSGIVPPKYVHITNFIRVFKTATGEERLAILGDINQNSSSGGLYLFDAFANAPYHYVNYSSASSIGEMTIADFNADGYDDFLMGTSNMIQDSRFISLDVKAETRFEQQTFTPNDYSSQFDRSGYRVGQPNLFSVNGESRIVMLFGSVMFIIPPDFDESKLEILHSSYSFNDAWKIEGTNKLVLASSQSGGNAVHILDLDNNNWKTAYTEITPPGNIQKILDNTAIARQLLADYDPTLQPVDSKKIYFMTESRTGVEDIIDELSAKYDSPQFLRGYHVTHCEDRDRSTEISSVKYQDKRDSRKNYDYTQQQALDMLIPLYNDTCGVAYWGGHGNDPLYFSLDTRKKVLDAANGKKTVLIFPELEAHDDNFASVLEEYFIPLAEYCQGKNANIYIRTKHTFWQGIAHMPLWEFMQSGKYADVFVPSMEETTDKSMDLSVPSRMGFWMSGATDSWGARCARDNTSFYRLRQHSHQMLPNHFLRQMIYNVANGAQYLNNFAVDQEYFSILYELIAKDVLYVPKRNELLSISPVHLSIVEPDEFCINEGSNTKWLTFYDPQVESDNKLVFSHLNGTWEGAPVTEWDFSRYANGVNDRHLNFLPPNPNGLVLITPVEAPYFSGNLGSRKKIAEHLHPMYKAIMTEYITDGRNYIAADSSETYPAETYYTTIADEIKLKSQALPLTVEGKVAWVLAQTSPTHLRLTLIDGGYINPDDREVSITFHSVTPVGMKDLLDKTEFNISNTKDVKVNIPCGLFRFIDIELSEAL